MGNSPQGEVARVLTWQRGNKVPAPKDRAIVVMGAVFYPPADLSPAQLDDLDPEDRLASCCAESVPFLAEIEWKMAECNSRGDWYYVDSSYEMAVRRSLDAEVIIHWWIDVPQESEVGK